MKFTALIAFLACSVVTYALRSPTVLASGIKGKKLNMAESTPTKTLSLYERLGVWSQKELSVDNEAALRATVDVFYTKVLGDDRLKIFFEGVDLGVLRDHQVL